MVCAGLDAERADDAHLLAERDRQRGVGCAAADQQRGRVMQGIGVGQNGVGMSGVVQPAQHGRVQRPHPQRRVGARGQARERRIGAVERQGIWWRRCDLADDDQRHIGLQFVERYSQVR